MNWKIDKYDEKNNLIEETKIYVEDNLYKLKEIISLFKDHKNKDIAMFKIVNWEKNINYDEEKLQTNIEKIYNNRNILDIVKVIFFIRCLNVLRESLTTIKKIIDLRSHLIIQEIKQKTEVIDKKIKLTELMIEDIKQKIINLDLPQSDYEKIINPKLQELNLKTKSLLETIKDSELSNKNRLEYFKNLANLSEKLDEEVMDILEFSLKNQKYNVVNIKEIYKNFEKFHLHCTFRFKQFEKMLDIVTNSTILWIKDIEEFKNIINKFLLKLVENRQTAEKYLNYVLK